MRCYGLVLLDRSETHDQSCPSAGRRPETAGRVPRGRHDPALAVARSPGQPEGFFRGAGVKSQLPF